MCAAAVGAVVAAGQSVAAPFVDAGPRMVGAVLPVAQATTAIGGVRLAIAGTGTAQGADLDPASAVDVASLAKAAFMGDQLARDTQLVEAAQAHGAMDAHVLGGQAFVRPAEGTFTSGFGGRWGAFHYGVDIANAIGTPIYAVTDGVVEDAGPVSGFGLWVVLRHPDGTHSVYGHVNRMFVTVGQHVAAGQQIAEIGNRGESTGPHLHFEIWAANGTKINPLPWLLAHGIDITRAAAPAAPMDSITLGNPAAVAVRAGSAAAGQLTKVGLQ
jgi:murein DD-endopeptidase MepM/ murein hydrolase activator NlpD